MSETFILENDMKRHLHSQSLFNLSVSCLTLFLILMATVPAQAYENIGGSNVLIGFPQGEFEDNVANKSVGLSGIFGLEMENMPLTVGIEIGYLIYDIEQSTRRTSNNDYVEVSTTNNILLVDPFLRIQSQYGFLRPYMEALTGFSYIFTTTSIDNSSYHDGLEDDTELGDITYNFGMGGGLHLKIYGRKSPQKEQSGSIEIWIDAGVRYLFGGSAEYYGEAPGIYDVAQIHESTTNMVILKIGGFIRF